MNDKDYVLDRLRYLDEKVVYLQNCFESIREHILAEQRKRAASYKENECEHEWKETGGVIYHSSEQKKYEALRCITCGEDAIRKSDWEYSEPEDAP